MKVTTVGFRKCNRCGETKPLAELVPHPRYHQGHQPLCRLCNAARQSRSDRDRRAISQEARVNRTIAEKKTCTTCFIEKPGQDFNLDIREADGLSRRCRECKSNLRVKEDPRLNRDRHMRWKYGIGVNEYEAMFEAQNGVCKVCLRPQQTKGRSHLDVDHCHETGRVRGLLCSHCNTSLGLLGEDPTRIEALLRYLQEAQP